MAIADIFNEAVAHHQAGRLPAAEALYLEILKAQPNHADALHLLGVIEHQRGRNEQAIELIRRAIALGPGNAAYYSNLAVALRGLKRLPEAVTQLEQAVKLAPDYAAAHKNLAVTLSELGRIADAVLEWHRAVDLNPKDGGAFKGLGASLMRLGRCDEAAVVFARAVALRADDPEALNNLGAAFNDLHRPAEAEKHLGRALELSPNNAEVHNNLGLALGALGRKAEAIEHLRRAVELSPGFALAFNNLGVALKDSGNLAEALVALQQALKIDPRHVAAHNNLGDVLNSLARYDEALRFLNRALELDPNCFEALNNLGVTLSNLDRPAEAARYLERSLQLNPRYLPAHVNLGNALVAEGHIEEGTTHYLRAIELDPNGIGAYYALASNSRYKFTADQVAHVESLLATARSADDRMLLEFALGLVLDKAGRYDQAFAYCREANDLKKAAYRKQGIAFNPEAHGALVERIVSTFTPEFFKRTVAWGDDSEVPVFIVGMPRSSTTLVEQIVSSHPAVFGAGELADIELMAADLPKTLGTTSRYPECLAGAAPEAIRKLAEGHLRHLRELGGEAARVVDKMTVNFVHLGLIATLFPRARVIHCIRDPRDICVSCYFHNFARAGLAFTFDLEHLGVFYAQYERLMAHWHRVLPLQILDVPYEQLVGDQEGFTRKMIEFCGLPWDPRCMAFEKNPRPVKTASALQVRQPMYKTSLARWKHFEKHLAPFMNRLNAGGGQGAG